EQDHEPLEGPEREDAHSDLDSAGWRDNPLNEAADKQEHQPVCPAEDPTVRAALADRLGLRPHVGSQEDPKEGKRSDGQAGVHRVESNASEHEDVRVSVEHVVQKVTPGGRLSGHFCDLSVQRVEIRVYEDEEVRHSEDTP